MNTESAIDPKKDSQLIVLAGLFIVLTVYYWFMTPQGITYGDGPELFIAIVNKQMTHPSGYPMFVMLGDIVSIFITDPKYSYYVLLLSSIPMSIALTATWFWLYDNTKSKIVSMLFILIFATSDQVVLMATHLEVYAISMIFIVLSLIVLSKIKLSTEKYSLVILSVTTISLALCNHLTTVFLIPVFGYMYFDSKIKCSKKQLGLLFTISLSIGFIFYGYSWLRVDSIGHGYMWSNFSSIHDYWAYVKGEIYNNNFDPKSIFWNFAYVLELGLQYFSGSLWLVIYGIFILKKEINKRYIGAFILLCGYLIYLSIYTIPDIETYLPMVWIPYTLFCVIAVLDFGKYFDAKYIKYSKNTFIVFVLAGFGLVVNRVIDNWELKFRDAEANLIIDQLGENVTENTIILASGDEYIFPLMYYAHFLAKEKNISVIAIDVATHNSSIGYRDYLTHAYPQIVWPKDMPIENQETQWLYQLLDVNIDKHQMHVMSHSLDLMPKEYSYKPNGWSKLVLRKTEENYGTLGNVLFAAAGVKHIDTIYWISLLKEKKTDTIYLVSRWNSQKKLKLDLRLVSPTGRELFLKGNKAAGYNELIIKFKTKEKEKGIWLCEIYHKKTLNLSTSFTVY